MTSTTDKAVGLTKFLVGLPKARYSFAILLLLGIITGVISQAITIKGFDSFSLVLGAGSGVLLLVIPGLLSSFSATLLARTLPLKRTLALAVVGSIVYALFYLAAVASQKTGFTVFGAWTNIAIVGFGVVFVLWWAVCRIAFGLKYKSLLLAALQLLYYAVFLIATESMSVSLAADPFALLVKTYFSAIAFLAAVYVIFWFANAPMKRNFGVSTVDALTLFLAQWIRQSKEIENMLESVGEEVETTVAVAGFWGKRGPKAWFIAPGVHYGPFGNLGGSEFPALIARELSYKKGVAFVFHAPATHDFNPTTSSEVTRITKACDKAIAEMKPKQAMASLAVGKQGSAKAYCLRINDWLLASVTRAPLTTEDVDYAVGMAISYSAKALGVREAAVLDCHNSETGEIMRVDSGNPIGFQYLDAVHNGMTRAQEKKMLFMGVHYDPLTELGLGTGLGAGGLKTSVMRIGAKTHSALLFDANGITPVFRRELLDRLKTIVDSAEVYTTDTHCVNAVNGVLNPLGPRNAEKLISKSLESVKAALSDLEPVKSDLKVKRFNINVMGVKQSSELIGTVNSIVAILRVAAPIILIGTIFAVLWAITKL